MFVQIDWDTPRDAEKYMKQVEKREFMIFLAGLVPELDVKADYGTSNHL